jgi:hypothetical protein
LRHAKACARATRRQARAWREGRRVRWRVFSILVKEAWLGKATIAGSSAHPPTCPSFRPFSPELSAPFVIPPVLCPLLPFFPPSSNLCLLLLLALPPRPVLPFCPRVVHATTCKPLGPRVGVWSSSPSLLCLLLSPMLPTLSFSNACIRDALCVLRRAVRSTPCAPRRACHAVRRQICLKDVFKNGCAY